MDQYISVSGLTGDYEIGNGQYAWDADQAKYIKGDVVIYSTIIAQLFTAWNLYIGNLEVVVGPLYPFPNATNACGRYVNETQRAVAVVG